MSNPSGISKGKLLHVHLEQLVSSRTQFCFEILKTILSINALNIMLKFSIHRVLNALLFMEEYFVL